MCNFIKEYLLIIIFSILSTVIYAQQNNNNEKCGTDIWLKNVFINHPIIKSIYQNNELKLANAITNAITLQKESNSSVVSNNTIYTFPVVFHVVLSKDLMTFVTDKQLQQEINELNLDFSGLNSDSTNIPPAFQLVRGHSTFRFCLARRDPNNKPSTGIVRVVANTPSNITANDPIKVSALGGSDAWDPDRYINIWIGTFTNEYSDVLGYTSFPIPLPENVQDILQNQQGIVIAYNAIYDGMYPNNLGRTVVHEMGHYFWLRHPWGDGVCADAFPLTPQLADVPRQSNPTSGCPNGFIETGCPNYPNPPGRMYQNFMDYTNDACYSLFTNGQNMRAFIALLNFRPSLITSNGCSPMMANEANISIANPTNNSYVCATQSTITPNIDITNIGTATITQMSLSYTINGQNASYELSNINYPSGSTHTINLPTINIIQGTNLLKVQTVSINGNSVLNSDSVYFTNGTVSLPISETFQSNLFPPPGWQITGNSPSYLNWQRSTINVSQGVGSAYINLWNNASIGDQNYLIMPPIDVSTSNTNSRIVLTFNHAYRLRNINIPLDTLEVVASNDCGSTWNVVWQQYGQGLVTSTGYNLYSWFPTSALDWSQQPNYVAINTPPGNSILLAFRTRNGNGDNVFINNVQAYNTPTSSNNSFLLFPNPTTNQLSIENLNTNSNIKLINIANMYGSIIQSINNSSAASNITINVQNFATGIYEVIVVFADNTFSIQLFTKTNL